MITAAEILSRVEIDEDGCWLWRGPVDRIGYGKLWWHGRQEKAHRAAYFSMVGPIPEGLEFDHLCRVRHCVNPDHLEPVTHQENCARKVVELKTHCKRGHPYAGANLYVKPDGFRDCRICRTEARRRYEARQRLGRDSLSATRGAEASVA